MRNQAHAPVVRSWYGFFKTLVLHWHLIGTTVVITQHDAWAGRLGHKVTWLARDHGVAAMDGPQSSRPFGAEAAHGMGVLDKRQHHRGKRNL